jgi:hypothetical protein
MQSSNRDPVPATKPAPKASRKAYVNPKLAKHGDVRSITQVNGGNCGSRLWSGGKPA